MRLIGFSGRKGSGKSMLANVLKEKYGAEAVSLANPIKELCSRLLGITVDQLNELKNSDEPLKRSIVYYDKTVWVSTIRSEVPGIPEQAVSEWVDSVFGDANYTARAMLQTIGTELIRKFDEDWHIRRMLDTIRNSESDMVVVDDIRFPNEKDSFIKAGGTVFFVLRPDLSIPVSNHSSENSIHWHDFEQNRIILNMYDMDFMKQEFLKVIENPRSQAGSPIIAENHEPCDDVCGFGRVLDVLEYPVYCHYMKTIVIPSLIKHNGCLVVNTDSISVLKWLENYIPHVLGNQVSRYSPRLETITYWNPFLVENVKEWL